MSKYNQISQRQTKSRQNITGKMNPQIYPAYPYKYDQRNDHDTSYPF